jgi:hypothetical protein
MMTRAIVVAALMCLVPGSAYSDGRVNFRVDFNATSVASAYNHVGLNWQGTEFEIEKEFTPGKVLLSGVSLGLRREIFYAFTGFGGTRNVPRWDEGTYLSLRIYRSFGTRSWSLGPSFALLYGIPGTTLDRTVDDRYSGGNGYTHVFPLRNSDVPKLLADKAELAADSALLYPEASIVFRKRLAKGFISLDWMGGVRIIRFGVVDSNTQGDVFTRERVLIPSFGMRVGFKIF